MGWAGGPLSQDLLPFAKRIQSAAEAAEEAVAAWAGTGSAFFRNDLSGHFVEAFFLELAEGFEGAVEGAFVAGGVAVAEAEDGVVDVAAGVEGFAFAVAAADEAPVVFDHFLDEDALGHGGGFVLVHELAGEDLVLLGIFVGKQEHHRTEAVAKSVFGRLDLAHGRFGTGVELAVVFGVGGGFLGRFSVQNGYSFVFGGAAVLLVSARFFRHDARRVAWVECGA